LSYCNKIDNVNSQNAFYNLTVTQFSEIDNFKAPDILKEY